jgi:hypothetical protein
MSLVARMQKIAAKYQALAATRAKAREVAHWKRLLLDYCKREAEDAATA